MLTGNYQRFGRRFRTLRAQLGLTQRELADRLGITAATYNRYENGHREASFGILERLLQIDPRISPQWLMTEQGPMLLEPESGLPLTNQYVRVPVYGFYEDGDGREDVRPVDNVSTWALSAGWIRHVLGCPFEGLFLLPVRDDSMVPTLWPNAMALVDAAERTLCSERIYVLRVGRSVLVKRVQWLSETELEMVSDNPAYQARSIRTSRSDGAVHVLGRVLLGTRVL